MKYKIFVLVLVSTIIFSLIKMGEIKFVGNLKDNCIKVINTWTCTFTAEEMKIIDGGKNE